MKDVLAWVKQHPLIPVFSAVVLLALGLGFWFSGSVNAGVRSEAEARAAKLNDLASIEKGSVNITVPGKGAISRSTVINQRLLDEYAALSGALKEDADRIVEAAMRRNRGEHAPIMSDVFPQPKGDRKRQTLSFDFHAQLVKAYEKLLRKANAGMPPPSDELVEAIQRREIQYIQSTLRKNDRESLTAAELADLKAELAAFRLSLYGEAASKLTVYADEASLEIPPSPEQARRSSSVDEMFDWQWRLWIASDILGAVVDSSAAANGGEPASVLRSPVKRIVSIRTLDALPLQASASGGAGGGMGMGMGMGMGGEAAAPAAAAAADEMPLAEPRIDVGASVSPVYDRVFTGRDDNAVYDVRRVEVRLVAATARLPYLFDALARRNFITVVDVSLEPADAFEAARQGFLYGKEPVSSVRLELETVWFRSWTAPLMPAKVREALGIGGAAAEDFSS